MRLIDADKLLKDLGEEPYVWTDTDAEIQVHSDWLHFKDMIEAQPTINAVLEVYAKWKNGVCTACGFDLRDLTDGENDLEQWVWDEGFHYCPYCGARMEWEE